MNVQPLSVRLETSALWSVAIFSMCWMKAVLPSPALPVSMTSLALASKDAGNKGVIEFRFDIRLRVVAAGATRASITLAVEC